MNIVHCFFTMETGGSQILAVDLLNEMCANHKTSLIIINNKFNKKLIAKLNSKVKVHYINRKEGSKNPIPILKLNLLLLKIRPHIIHCHEPKIVTAIKIRGFKFVYTVHDVGLGSAYLKDYNLLAAISEAVKKDVISLGDYKIVTINNGIANQLFKQRKNYLLEDKEPIKLVQISRLVHEKKGQDILLLALAKIVNDSNYFNFILDVVGGGESLGFLKKIISKNKLEKHVNFLGEKDRDWIYDNLCNYQALIQPSRYEGFGLTIVEGFAAGLLVLASNIDGPLEIINKTKRGFVFENENIDDCAEKLKTIFNLYKKNEVQLLVNETPNLAETVYSIKTCANKYLEQYALVLNNK